MALTQLGLVLALHRFGPFVIRVLGIPLLLSPFLRPNLPLLQILNYPLLLQIWIGLQSEVGRDLGWRRRKIDKNLGLGGLF